MIRDAFEDPNDLGPPPVATEDDEPRFEDEPTVPEIPLPMHALVNGGDHADHHE